MWAAILYPYCSRKGEATIVHLENKQKWNLHPFFSRNWLIKKKKKSITDEQHLVGFISSKTPSLLPFPSSLKLLWQVFCFIAANVLSLLFSYNLSSRYNCLNEKRNLEIPEIVLVSWREGKETTFSPKDKTSSLLTDTSLWLQGQFLSSG